MALNVNIIGKDSEGNLRALKVNSEGNLDFGQLETEIQAVKQELQAIKNSLTDGTQKVTLSGTIVVKTVGDLPSTGYMAQVALVSEGQRVFIYDGNEWGEW